MLPEYKLEIFVRGVTARMIAEDLSRDEILKRYKKLSEEDKEELRRRIPATPEELS